MGMGIKSATIPGRKMSAARYVPEQYRNNFGDQNALGNVAVGSKESPIGPLPGPVETSQVLAQAALRGAVTIKENTMSEQAPEYDAAGLPKNEGDDAFDVRDAWPAGQLAPGTEPLEEQ